MHFDRVLLSWVPFLALAAPAIAADGVSPEVFEATLATVSSDAFEGRRPATRGEEKTVEYLVGEFRRLGLEPGANGSYTQQVPLVEITPAPDATLAFATPKGTIATTFREDSVVFTKRVVPDARLVDSEVVFVGHGIVAPEYGWNDYAGVDMRGKTALILINDPGFATGDETIFRGKALTYYGRWTYKYEEAARQGAAGAIIIHETEPAAYGWATVVNSWGNPQLDMQTADNNMGRVALEGWITRDVAEKVLTAAGQDYETLKRRAQARGAKPVVLPVAASGSVRNIIRRSNSANVVATLPGTKRPGEYVVYMAHWDHLGRTLAGEGDTIFNGAVDNGTGIAGLIAIADAYTKSGVKPERTVVFLAVTAEEQGLLGSAFYAANPLFPLAQTVAVLNMDALYFAGPTRDVPVVGYGASELERYLVEEASARGLRVVPESQPEKGYFYRSDHFNFAKAGVPALYIKVGIDDVDGGVAAGRAREDDFVAARYHQIGDEFVPGTDLRGPLACVDLLYDIGRRLANDTGFPNWNADNEFRAARDRSRAIAK